MSRLDATAKMAFDRAAAGLGLLVLSPILLMLVLALRLSAGSPVMFRQTRAGKDGKPFTILKLRTMDMRGSSCCNEPGRCRGVQMEQGLRPSRLQATLRRTGLDELPQLLNVLRGDMSFVGPRPLMVRYLDRYTTQQRRRQEVLPGITGWAQVNGRTDLAWDERLALDVWYVDHRSMGLDLRILWLTVRTAAGGAGYSQSGSDTGLEFMGTGVDPALCPATGSPLAIQSPSGPVGPTQA